MITIATPPPSKVVVRGTEGRVKVSARAGNARVRVVQSTTPSPAAGTDLVAHYRLLSN